jgi:hypothetical protein
MSDPISTNWRRSLPSSPARKRGGRPPVRSASSRASRKSSALSRSTVALRSTGKTATSSSGCMPCASTACARSRTAAPLLEPLDHQGLLAGAPTVAEPVGRRTTSIDDWPPNWQMLPTRTTSPSCAMSAPAPTSAPPRRSRTASRARTSRRSSRLFERVATEIKTGMRQSQPIEAGRRAIEAGDFFVLDGITLYVAEVGEPLKTTAGEVDRRLRLIFCQRHREQSAAALAAARVLQRPRRAAAGLAGERATVLRR